MENNYLELNKLLDNFEWLDRRLKKNAYQFYNDYVILRKSDNDAFNHDFRELYNDLFWETIAAKRKIKNFLAERTYIKAGDFLEIKLKNIRDNEGYSVDILCTLFEEFTGKKIDQEKEDEEWHELLFKEGIVIDYIDDSFYRRRNQIGAIICKKSLPPNLNYHLNKVKECFSLGLFEATVIYCRALIESGTYQALKNRDKKVIHIRRELKLSELLSRIKRYKRNLIIIGYAYDVKNLADDELHETEEIIKINENIASEAIKKTYSYIEYIFNNFEK
jgi:hypothetical protein